MSDAGVSVTLRYPDAREVEFRAETGISLMQAVTSAGLDGILAECGGSLSCATCHVVVESAPCDIGTAGDDEDEMLDCTATERQPGSRLSCQVILSSEMSPLVVGIPGSQK